MRMKITKTELRKKSYKELVELAKKIDSKVEIGRSDLSYKEDIIDYIYQHKT